MIIIDKTIWMMVGTPGSGKTWVAKNILMRDSWAYISRDEIRFSIITDEDDYFKKENIVFAEFINHIKNAIEDNSITDIIVDATHLNWNSRRKLLHALGRETGEHVIPVVIENNIFEILHNNRERTGRARVPELILRNMHLHMTDPATDPIKYEKIMRINNHRGKYDLDNI